MLVKVFVQDLAAANSGFIVGEFIALPCEEKEIENHIKVILERGQEICQDGIHEEWFIAYTEWEEDIEVFSINEFENIFSLNKKLIQLEENVEPDQYGIIKVLIDNGFASSLEEAIDKIENVIVHYDSSMEDIAENYISEIIDLDSLPLLLSGHIDFKGIGRDMEIDCNFIQENSDIFEIIE